MREKRLAASRKGGENRATAKRLDKLVPASLKPTIAVLFAALLWLSGLLATEADVAAVRSCVPSQVPCAGARPAPSSAPPRDRPPRTTR